MELEEQAQIEKPKSRTWKILRRIFLFITLFPISLFLALVLLVFIYEDEVKKIILNELNKKLNVEIRIEPNNIDFTVVKTFPRAALQFKNVTAFESIPFDKHDTLFYAGLLSLEFNISDLWNENYNIRRLFANETDLRLKIDKDGNINYRLLKKDSLETKGKSMLFRLEDVELQNSRLSYKNKKSQLKLNGNIHKLHLKGIFYEENYRLNVESEMLVKELTSGKRNWIKNKNTVFKISMDAKGDNYVISEASLKFNSIDLNTKGKIFKRKDIWEADLNFKAENLEFSSLLSLLPEENKKTINDYASEGIFYANGSYVGSLENIQNSIIELNFGMDKANVRYTPNNIELSQLNLKGNYSKNGIESERLQIQHFSGLLENDAVEGDILIENFNDPYLEFALAGNVNLENLNKFYPIDTLENISGRLSLDASIKGKLKSLKEDFSSTTNVSNGKVTINKLDLKLKNDTRHYKVESGTLTLEQVNIKADSLNVSYGENHLMIQGELNNFMAWALKENEDLSIAGKLFCNELFAEDILMVGSSSGNSEFRLNPHLRLSLDLDVRKVHWKKFTGTHLAGNVKIMDNKIWADNISFETMNGDVAFTGLLDAREENIIKIGGSAKLVGIDVHQLFYQLNNFGQNVLQEKHLKGTATATVDFTANWDRNLKCDLNSIKSTADLRIEKGELIGFQPLEKLSKHVSIDELKHIRFSNFTSHVEIRNQIITISKTELANSAMNLDFYGTHSFDNQIDYHIKMLLSEVMANRPGKSKELDEELAMVENDPENKRCVFISMKGPLENPEIKYDRKAAGQKIKEDIKKEKQNLKQILKEEFGWFKKDTTLKNNNTDKSIKDQNFKIDFGEQGKKDKNKPKPKEETEDDDF